MVLEGVFNRFRKAKVESNWKKIKKSKQGFSIVSFPQALNTPYGENALRRIRKTENQTIHLTKHLIPHPSQ